MLHELAADSGESSLVRATAIWYLGQMINEENAEKIKEYLTDNEAMVRHSAVNALEVIPRANKVNDISPLLNDPSRSVRTEAVAGLSGIDIHLLSENQKVYFASATKEYLAALAMRADFPGGQLEKAVYYERNGNAGMAEQAYLRAIRNDNYYNMARINLANLYYSQRRFQEAEQLFLKVIEQEPEFGESYYSLGLLYAEMNDMQNAKIQLGKAADFIQNNERVLYNYGLVLQNLGEIPNAIRVFERAIAKYPQSVSNLYALAVLRYQLGDVSAAKTLTERLLQIEPQNPQFIQFLQTIQLESFSTE